MLNVPVFLDYLLMDGDFVCFVFSLRQIRTWHDSVVC